MEENYKYFEKNVIERLKYLSFSFHMKVRLSSGKFNFFITHSYQGRKSEVIE